MKDVNYWLNVFLNFYNKNSTQDAKELGYSTCLFHNICDKVCCYYVKNCVDNWEVINGSSCNKSKCYKKCNKDITIIFLGIKRNECLIDPSAYGHRNAIFLYHNTREYLWFDPEGSDKRKINIKPLLRIFGCDKYKEIKMNYSKIQKEPEDDNGYCAAWCYLFCFLAIETGISKKEMINTIIPKIKGNMKIMKGFGTFFVENIE